MATWWWRAVHVAIALMTIETAARFLGADTRWYREGIGIYCSMLIGAAWVWRMCRHSAAERP